MAGRSLDFGVRRAALRHLDELCERVRAGVDDAARELVAIGTPEAKGALFSALHRVLVSDALGRCGDAHAAEDAAVRAFDAAWELTAVRGRTIEVSLIGYFRNAAKSSGAKERGGALKVSRGEATDPHVLIDLTVFPDTVSDALEALESECDATTLSAAVSAGLSTLPPRARQILDVRLATTTLRAAADTLGMTPQAASVSTSRATKSLRASVLQFLAPKASQAPEPCRPVLASMGQLLTGQLSPADTVAANDHIEQCERCATAYAELDDTKKRYFASRVVRAMLPLPLLRKFARPMRWMTRTTPRAVGAASTAAVFVASVGLAAVPSLRPWAQPVIHAPQPSTGIAADFARGVPPYATPASPWLSLFPAAPAGNVAPRNANTTPFGLAIGGYTDPSGHYDPLKNAPLYIATPAAPWLTNGSSAPLLELSLDPFANVPQTRPASDPHVAVDLSQPADPKVQSTKK
ncbi:MAG TPA: hypothetical protein VHD87_15660 [Acidimicrobiales bacterium]|nr:hypothetical protein [Acidimicrobiales bacterium]